jgi:hypothetical protein
MGGTDKIISINKFKTLRARQDSATGEMSVKSTATAALLGGDAGEDNAPRWTAAMVEARLKEAFETDRRLPNPGPRNALSPADHKVRESWLPTPDEIREAAEVDGEAEADTDRRPSDDPPPFDLRSCGFTIKKIGIVRDIATAKKEAEIEQGRLLAEARELVAERAALFAELCRLAEGKLLQRQRGCGPVQRMYEALDWLAPHELDRHIESCRRTTINWLRSGADQNAHAKRIGVPVNTLRRQIYTYCNALANRLDAPRSPPSLKLAHLIYGLPAIAAYLMRNERSVRRMMFEGRLPVGTLFGELCGHPHLLWDFREMHTVRRVISEAA